MTDLEIVKKCAEKMGFTIDDGPCNGGGANNTGVDVLGRVVLDWHEGIFYDPLHDDEQAMALVKRFRLSVDTYEVGQWRVYTEERATLHGEMFLADGDNLNRAICECVAKLPDDNKGD